MKFSVIKKIDHELLKKNIEIYEAANGEFPYIFMNKETIKAISDHIVYFIDGDRGNRIDMIHSCLLYCNNSLEFGEVELR